MRVIYADTLFITNFIINYLILLATAKICSSVVRRARLAAAASIGGAYSVFAALPPTAFLGSPAVIIAAGLLMILAAFGGKTGLVRISLVFFAVSATFAGAVLAVGLLGGGGAAVYTPVSFRVLVLSFGVCYAAVALVFKRMAARKDEIVTIKVRHGTRELEIKALVDTGNTLCDPITGMPVIITGVSEARRLFARETRHALSGIGESGAVGVIERLGETSCPVRFQLIPYSAVGVAGGMLLAFRPDEIIVNGKEKKEMLVALSPNSVSDNGTYSALIGA